MRDDEKYIRDFCKEYNSKRVVTSHIPIRVRDKESANSADFANREAKEDARN